MRFRRWVGILILVPSVVGIVLSLLLMDFEESGTQTATHPTAPTPRQNSAPLFKSSPTVMH